MVVYYVNEMNILVPYEEKYLLAIYATNSLSRRNVMHEVIKLSSCYISYNAKFYNCPDDYFNIMHNTH